MTAPKYPAVPAPAPTTESLHRTVTALYQGYNALTGQPRESELAVNNTATDTGVSIPDGTLLQGLIYNSGNQLLASHSVAKLVASVSFEGNGAAAPTLGNRFNVDSVAAPSPTGRYRVTLDTKTISGHDILQYTIPCINHTPGEPGPDGTYDKVKNAYLISANPTAGTFDIQCYEYSIEGTGANARVVARSDNLESGEYISVVLLLSGSTEDERM